MPQKKLTRAMALLGAVVALSAMPVADAAGGVWNVLAYEVSMKASGVKLTKADFEACVKNFGAYPKVPLVVEHADTHGGPAAWAEPCGWITELRVGTFTRPDGRVVASLEGKLQTDETTRAAINGAEGAPPKWPFGSVTVFKGRDEETDTDLGMCLWSFSLTAHPRLIDVPRLAAGAPGPGAVEAGYWYGEIETRGDVLAMLRCVFDLPVAATEADVLAALERLAALASAEDSEGVDVGRVVDRLREALRLPVLTTIPEVLAQVRTALADLPPAPTATMSRGPAAQENPMSKFIALAASLACVTAKTDDEAYAAIEAHTTKQRAEARATREALRLSADAPHAEVLGAVSALSTSAAKVPALEAKLGEFEKAAAERFAADVKAHVDDYIAAGGPEREASRAALDAFARADYAAFSKAYPRPSAAEKKERAQDAKRFASIGGGKSAKAPAPKETTDQIGASDMIAAAERLCSEAEAQGTHLSFSEAMRMVESGDEQFDEPSALAADEDEAGED